MNYVIIGNSAAAIGAVEGIRRMDKDGSITMLSKEPYHTYSRPLISYLLLGKVCEQNMKYRGEDFYHNNGAKLLAGVEAISVDSGAKNVVLDNGDRLPYDKLLIATGSSPFIPPFEGLDTVENWFTFMSLDDGKRLGASISKDKRVLIVGAGLIGLKCAEGILDRVKEITVIDQAPTILSSILSSDGAQRVRTHLESKGIEFRLGQRVKSFAKNAATVESGEKIGFDILVLALGVRPNTSLVQGHAEIQKAIVVDSAGRTTAQDIYAAGDCTQCQDVSSGENKIMALLPNAYMQGECAGINMAGGKAEFDKAIPMNAIGFFGMHIITAGNYKGEVYNGSDQDNYKKLFYDNNRLNGYILIGTIDKAGIYTGLVRDRTPLDSLDFDLICQKPGLMAFGKEPRAIKLGTGV